MMIGSERFGRLATCVAGALALAACAADAPPRQWVQDDAAGPVLAVALADCRSWVDERFNPGEDFSSALGSTGSEESLNRRAALRRLWEECMRERGYHLQ